MSQIPSHIKNIHFIGIGGIGMSGIAEVLHQLEFQVRGSDISDNLNVQRLRALGIPITIGHQTEALENAQAVVVSTAVREGNPELEEARRRYLPIVHRSEMLAEIMRTKNTISIAGTHGKTTTTSLIAALFEAAQTHPTVINGGIINTYGSNARHGKGDWVIAEADESDGSFLRLPTTFGVITNIDPEHMEYYNTFESLKQAFRTFIDKLPFYGLGILCADHPVVKEMAHELSSKRIVTYGLEKGADVWAYNIRSTAQGSLFDVQILPSPILTSPLWSQKVGQADPVIIKDLFLPMMGLHNVQNSLATVAIAQEMGFDAEILKKALSGFQGVKRRFTRTGIFQGVPIIDDYAHHPVEIQTVLKAARQATQGRIHAIIQPHRYTRLQSLFQDFCECFKGCDNLFVAPVYAAGEPPIPNYNSSTLVEGIRKTGLADVWEISGEEDLPSRLIPLLTEGDLVLCMGAGTITYWAANLPERLSQFANNKA